MSSTKKLAPISPAKPSASSNIIGDGFLFHDFINEELDFIINYDIKYRMGASDAEDDNGA